MIGSFPCSLELQPVISQTQPVHLQLTAGSPQSLFVKLNQLNQFSFIQIGVYSIDSSKMIANFPAVVNFNQLFLKLYRFIFK